MVRRFRQRVNAGVRPGLPLPAGHRVTVNGPISRRARRLPHSRCSIVRSLRQALDKSECGCNTALNQKTEETMNINRRTLMLPALVTGLAIGLLSAVPAFAGPDED